MTTLDAGGPALAELPAVGIDAPALARLLAGVELADLSEADVVAVVVGWQQLLGVVAAAQAAAVTELAARRRPSSSFPVDDLACALETTTHAAQALVGRAAGLAAHPVLADGLRAGLVDVRKVDVLLGEVSRLPHADADAVLRELVGDSAGMTGPMLRREARRLVAAVDPDAAAKRAAKARTERCVRLEHAGDAMAWVSALLPASDAVAMFSVVDTLARAAEGEGDVRTLPQRRADVLADVFATILAAGACPDGRRLPVRQGDALGLQLTMAASTFVRADDMPGELAGYGPIPAALARDLAEATDRFRPVLTDEAGHVLARGNRTHPTSLLRRPSPPPGATGDHPRGASGASGDHPRGSSGGSGDHPRGSSGGSGHHPLGADAGPVLVGPAGLVMAPSATDVGVAPSARPPASPDAPRKVGYRPDTALRRLVLARDETCTFPGCRQPGPVCDLDHIEPFDDTRPAEAQTCPENVQALCRHHHLAKTHHGWTMRRDAITGDVHVTSPLGLEYVRLATTVVLTESVFRAGLTNRARGQVAPDPAAATGEPPAGASSDAHLGPGPRDDRPNF